jgi:membrane-associated phospholipid phosphatase
MSPLEVTLSGVLPPPDVSAISAPSSSPAQMAPPMPTPIDHLGADLVDAFTGKNLLWYGGAFLASGAMAFGGFDQAIRVGVQRDMRSPPYADAAYYAGYVLPATVAPAVYIVGLAMRDPVSAGAGAAALQALAVTLLATGVLKVATGRPFPANGGNPDAADRLNHPEYARQFAPFHSVWPLLAWPSGHTSATTSIVAALTAYYPDEVWIPLVGYPVAALVGFGMIEGDNHWASDVLGGALLGHAIGYSVGAAFRRHVRASVCGECEESDLHLAPAVGSGFVGITVDRAW